MYNGTKDGGGGARGEEISKEDVNEEEALYLTKLYLAHKVFLQEERKILAVEKVVGRKKEIPVEQNGIRSGVKSVPGGGPEPETFSRVPCGHKRQGRTS